MQMVHRQVAVQWTTNEEAAGAEVQYGTSAGHYTGSATATFDTYTRTDMCGGEAATTGYLFPGVHLSHMRTCVGLVQPGGAIWAFCLHCLLPSCAKM